MAISRKLSLRQERFCRLVTSGVPPYRAYPQSGYSANNGSPYRLHENARVKARIAEIQAGYARRNGVTVASLTEELDRVIAEARTNKQPGAMVSAITLKAKLHGFLVERKETGAPGDFSGLTTAEEIVEKVRASAGEDAAQLIQAYVAKRNAGN